MYSLFLLTPNVEWEQQKKLLLSWSPALENKQHTTHHTCQHWSESWDIKTLKLKLRNRDLSYSNIILQYRCSWVKTRLRSLAYVIHQKSHSHFWPVKTILSLFSELPHSATFIPLMRSNTVENAKYKHLLLFLLITDIILFKVLLSRWYHFIHI